MTAIPPFPLYSQTCSWHASCQVEAATGWASHLLFGLRRAVCGSPLPLASLLPSFVLLLPVFFAFPFLLACLPLLLQGGLGDGVDLRRRSGGQSSGKFRWANSPKYSTAARS